ncbi:dihydrodipicolinate synthase family protein [Microbacterium gorillae]|uniref:dihydrodipicolinate synthase family protein n=1 Tax=Microbacterium gorillae TaxID=1231063 RepID=UPI00058EB57F|nr:dihydrodipicolinate synthase family protein [Microbacterium gorillae]
MTDKKPWHGVNLATTLPINPDFSVNYDGFAEHVRFVTSNGVTGLAPNGSLGEYQTLTEDERKQVFLTAVEASPAGTAVMPGVGAYGALESVRLTEHAAANGAPAVMLLPPNAYRASDDEVVDHFRRVAEVGLPILAYNNPIDTRVNLRPDLLARLYELGYIVSVKEFSGDVRNAYQIHELAPGLDVSIGSDDVLLELGINGAVGWVAGYPNVIPTSTVELYNLATSGDPASWAKGLEMYRDLHKLLRWDSKVWFVQAIKLSQEVAGVMPGGRTTRPPRLDLPEDVRAQIISDTEAVLAKGYR